MQTAEAVRQARNPQEAMYALATSLDELHAKLDRLEAKPAEPDPWGTWAAAQPAVREAVRGVPIPRHDFERDRQANAEEAQLVRQRLAEEHDPDERRALEARLRLLEDDGDIAPSVPDGHRATVQVGDSTIDVELPAVDPVRRQARYVWASEVGLGDMIEPKLPAYDAAVAFAKGGPMWLYLYDPAAVYEMPMRWRQGFIDDIAQDSPAQAQEVARDILKDRGIGVDQAVTIDYIKSQSRDED